MEKLNKFEKFFHNKKVIQWIFIFPLISSVFIAIAIKEFIGLHQTFAEATGMNNLFTLILAIMFINMLANFASLILYYCLHNRIESLSSKYKKVF